MSESNRLSASFSSKKLDVPPSATARVRSKTKDSPANPLSTQSASVLMVNKLTEKKSEPVCSSKSFSKLSDSDQLKPFGNFEGGLFGLSLDGEKEKDNKRELIVARKKSGKLKPVKRTKSPSVLERGYTFVTVTKKQTIHLKVKGTETVRDVCLRLHSLFHLKENKDLLGLYCLQLRCWLRDSDVLLATDADPLTKLLYALAPPSGLLSPSRSPSEIQSGGEIILMVHKSDQKKKGVKLSLHMTTQQALEIACKKFEIAEDESAYFAFYNRDQSKYLLGSPPPNVNDSMLLGSHNLKSQMRLDLILRPDTPLEKVLQYSEFEHNLIDRLESTNSFSCLTKGDKSLLHVAAEVNSEESVVKFLIKKKVDFSAPDLNSRTALHSAFLHHSWRCAYNIIMSCHSGGRLHEILSCYDSDGFTPFHYFIRDTDPTENSVEYKKILELIFGENGHFSFWRTKDCGSLPFHFAALANSLVALEYFIKVSGVHPSLRDLKGKTALHYAVQGGSVDCATYLMKNGTHLTLGSSEGQVALDIAIEKKDDSLSRLLADNRTLLLQNIWTAVKEQNFEELENLLTAKSYESQKMRGKDILEVAIDASARRGYFELTKKLLELPIVKEKRSFGVLHSVCTYLAEEGSPTLDLQISFIEKLIDQGESQNEKDEFGDIPLSAASLYGNLRVCQTLIGKGSFVNNVNSAGRTELHHAVLSGKSELVAALLSAGSDPSIQDHQGNTVTKLVNRVGLPAIQQLFAKKGSISKDDDEHNVKNLASVKVVSISIVKEHQLYKNIFQKHVSEFGTKNWNSSRKAEVKKIISRLEPEICKKNKISQKTGAFFICCLEGKLDLVVYLLSTSELDLSFVVPENFVLGGVELPPSSTPSLLASNGGHSGIVSLLEELSHFSVYCVAEHRMQNKVIRFNSKKFDLINNGDKIEGETTPLILVDQGGVYFRDLRFSVYVVQQIASSCPSPSPSSSFSSSSSSCFSSNSKITWIGREAILLGDWMTSKRTVAFCGPDGASGTLILDVELSLEARQNLKKIEKTYGEFDVFDEVKTLKKLTHKSTISEAKAAVGFRPKYPVIIVPGLASSALEALQTDKSAWKGERVWVDPFKIGRAAVFQKMSSIFSSKKGSKEKSGQSPVAKNEKMFGSQIEEVEVFEEGGSPQKEASSQEEFNRKWLQHMILAPDGFSDPPGIKVRPVPGLHGCDYLSDKPLVKSKSYVFGLLISALQDLGYDQRNLDAMTYDWRLPPEKLEERDNYFSRLKFMVMMMRQTNNRKVVLMGHSMGNRCVQYFLSWVLREEGQKWIDANIHAFCSLGPPFLGAPKCLRAVITGDTMDLEVFLTEAEGKQMCRRSGSLPWLFPVQADLLPDVVARITNSQTLANSQQQQQQQAILKRKQSILVEKKKHGYEEANVEVVVKNFAPRSWGYFLSFYSANPCFLGQSAPSVPPPVLAPPPVKNLWVINGINLRTEVSYFYRETTSAKGKRKLVLDNSADKYSLKKKGQVNPRGLEITGGTAYETHDTFQPTVRSNRSGDGTVPYCSLNYPSTWKAQAEAEDIPLKNVQIIEIEGAEHREMLTNEVVFSAVIDCVCSQF